MITLEQTKNLQNVITLSVPKLSQNFLTLNPIAKSPGPFLLSDPSQKV